MKPRRRSIRTVKMNDRGQIVIPEDVRADLRIKGNTTLVLIKRGDEIVLRREEDVLDELDSAWRPLSRRALSRAWDEPEDSAWDSHFSAESS